MLSELGNPEFLNKILFLVTLMAALIYVSYSSSSSHWVRGDRDRVRVSGGTSSDPGILDGCVTSVPRLCLGDVGGLSFFTFPLLSMLIDEAGLPGAELLSVNFLWYLVSDNDNELRWPEMMSDLSLFWLVWDKERFSCLIRLGMEDGISLPGSLFFSLSCLLFLRDKDWLSRPR